jgi:hypothetical protein
MIVKKSSIRLMRVHIDGQRLEFDGQGNCSWDLDPGEHALTWFVRGTPGESYSIEIAAPREACFKHSDQLDDSLQDAGLKWFRIK